MRPTFVLTLLGLFAFQQVLCSRILVLLPFSGRSHYMNIQPLVQELSVRGHHLTVIAPYSEKNVNYTQITFEKRLMWAVLKNMTIFDLEKISFTEMVDLVRSGTYFTSELAFNSSVVKKFIKEDDTHFDLIITEVFFQESMYMFAHKYKAPLVGICTFGFSQVLGPMMGNPLFTSYMTHEYLKFSHPLTFWERVKNTYHTVSDFIWREYYYMPIQQRMAERHFPDLPRPLPKLTDIEKRFSAVLINTHYSYDIARPYIPGVIEIGGFHIKKPKPLPKNIQKYLDEAKDGAVYFSLGSNIQSKDMSKDKLEIFLNVFTKMKQRILWKWEDEHLEGKPDNVMIDKWLPQNDILAHPNVKVFITHGGLLSTQESMYHGVPIMSLPFYGDQHLNADRMQTLGFGRKIVFLDITKDILEETLNDLIYNPKYADRARDLSERFRDRPLSAMDTAVFWIEYVIRQKGAYFMQSPALDLSVSAYFLLDILALLVVLGFILVRFVCSLSKISQKNVKQKRN